MYPVRMTADYSYAPMYGYSSTGGGFNSYPPPSRGVVGDLWRQPSINDGRNASYDYAYKEYQNNQGRGEFPVVGLRDELWTNRNTGSYGRGYEKEYIPSGKYGGTSTGYTGSMTGATNDIGTAMEQLMGAATGRGTKGSSRIGEVESPVNYYPAMQSSMDGSKRYGSISLGGRRSSYVGEPANYY